MTECPNDPDNGYGGHNINHPLPCPLRVCNCASARLAQATDEALCKDAARYRWLRNNPLWSVGYRVKPRSGMRAWRMRDDGDYWGPWWPTHEQAVDHAIKAQVAVGDA